MDINELLKKNNMTKYKLATLCGIPHATLSDICSGKARIEKCSAETIYKLCTALGISMESLVSDSMERASVERSYEKGLPEYLQHDLDAYKEGLKSKSSLLDCLWCELYGSINSAEISEGSISHEHATYLRQKYL